MTQSQINKLVDEAIAKENIMFNTDYDETTLADIENIIGAFADKLAYTAADAIHDAKILLPIIKAQNPACTSLIKMLEDVANKA